MIPLRLVSVVTGKPFQGLRRLSLRSLRQRLSALGGLNVLFWRDPRPVCKPAVDHVAQGLHSYPIAPVNPVSKDAQSCI